VAGNSGVDTPLPDHLQAELDRHYQRDPEFDASQMSKELPRWFRKLEAA
jgi:hypothetical protein